MAYEISFPLDLHLQDDCSTFEALLSWFPLETYDHAFCMELKYFARVMQMMNWSKRVQNSAFSHNDADSLLLFDKVIKALYDKQWALQKTHSYSDGQYAEKINEIYFKVSRATNISPPSLMIYLSNLQWLTAFKELNENDDLPFELPTFVANWLNSNNVSDYKAKNHIFKKESVYIHSHICANSPAQTEITEKIDQEFIDNVIQDVSQSLLSVTAEEFNQYCRDNMFKWAKRVPKTTSEWLNIICGDFIPEHLMTLGIVQCVFQFNSNNKEFISLSELPYTHFYLHDRSEVERHYDDAKHKFEFQNIEFEDDHHITLFFQAIE